MFMQYFVPEIKLDWVAQRNFMAIIIFNILDECKKY